MKGTKKKKGLIRVPYFRKPQVIHAHSQILSARSEVFRKQLTSGMQEEVSKVIRIEDCDAVTFRAFLQFLCGSVHL